MAVFGWDPRAIWFRNDIQWFPWVSANRATTMNWRQHQCQMCPSSLRADECVAAEVASSLQSTEMFDAKLQNHFSLRKRNRRKCSNWPNAIPTPIRVVLWKSDGYPIEVACAFYCDTKWIQHVARLQLRTRYLRILWCSRTLYRRFVSTDAVHLRKRKKWKCRKMSNVERILIFMSLTLNIQTNHFLLHTRCDVRHMDCLTLVLAAIVFINAFYW